jgi:7,8-dihydropterin-6-yl-methyl-4-(beta-D-ribofuranosyl)aminobenzene 5'-phosphate synthase
MIRITIAAENTVAQQGLIAEHGLACFIETAEVNILFDTGQGLVLQRNARQLGIDLARLDLIALSHRHYDHTGGLPDVLRAAPNASLVIHPASFENNFRAAQDGAVKDVGMPAVARRAIDQHARVIRSDGPYTLAPGIHLTGLIPCHSPFEPEPENFFSNIELTVPDPMPDDRALWIQTSEGLIILVGCSHRGVINTLNAITREAGTRRIHMLLGGMHLANADNTRIHQTVDSLRNEFEIEQLYPGHCTGMPAMHVLHRAFGSACHPLCTGLSIISGP